MAKLYWTAKEMETVLNKAREVFQTSTGPITAGKAILTAQKLVLPQNRQRPVSSVYTWISRNPEVKGYVTDQRRKFNAEAFGVRTISEPPSAPSAPTIVIEDVVRELEGQLQQVVLSMAKQLAENLLRETLAHFNQLSSKLVEEAEQRMKSIIRNTEEREKRLKVLIVGSNLEIPIFQKAFDNLLNLKFADAKKSAARAASLAATSDYVILVGTSSGHAERDAVLKVWKGKPADQVITVFGGTATILNTLEDIYLGQYANLHQ